MRDNLQPISFDEALGELHGYLGRQVQGAMLSAGHFLGIAFLARLKKAESLLPDGPCLTLHFDNGVVVDIDPTETRAFLGGGRRHKGHWLEFTVDGGRSVLTLMAPAEPGGE